MFFRFVQELSGHLATYDEFLKMANDDLASPGGITNKVSPTSSATSPTTSATISAATIAEARRQFARMLKVDAWELVKGGHNSPIYVNTSQKRLWSCPK